MTTLCARWPLALLAWSMLALSTTAASAAGQAERTKQDYQSGPYLYRVFCLSCHGATGKGDGPVADILRQRPSDLTRIASRRAGVFPRDEVTRLIDGREMVKSHGEMPVWGQRLQSVEGKDERLIRQRFEAVLSRNDSSALSSQRTISKSPAAASP